MDRPIESRSVGESEVQSKPVGKPVLQDRDALPTAASRPTRPEALVLASVCAIAGMLLWRAFSTIFQSPSAAAGPHGDVVALIVHRTRRRRVVAVPRALGTSNTASSRRG